MYEEIFKYLLRCRFDLSDEFLNYKVDLSIGNRVQGRSTDGVIPLDLLDGLTLPKMRDDWRQSTGLGFEVRSCYQIGDSKRIQADWDMAIALAEQGYTAIMLVFCATSLKSPVARLAKSWNLFEADNAFHFVLKLTDFDLRTFLLENKEEISRPIKQVLAKF